MRIRSLQSSIVASFAAAAVLSISSVALAQDPAPSAGKPPIVTPAPGQAAAAAPSPTAYPVTANCSMGEHHGVDEAEARTAADVICHELAKQRAVNGEHEVRFGKLGGKTLVVVATHNGNTYDERRTFLTGMDEIHVASPRLVSALVEGKPLEETRNVDNVLSDETRTAKMQNGSVGFQGTMFGTTGIGAESGASAGVAIGLLYRAGSFGATWDGRAGGIGSGDNKIGSATMDVGARYYLSSAEFAPFLGGGMGISYFELSHSHGGDMSGSGFGAYAQIGAEAFRTHHTGFSFAVRADLPFYKLSSDSSSYASGQQTIISEYAYVVPLSFNIGIIFH